MPRASCRCLADVHSRKSPDVNGKSTPKKSINQNTIANSSPNDPDSLPPGVSGGQRSRGRADAGRARTSTPNLASGF